MKFCGCHPFAVLLCIALRSFGTQKSESFSLVKQLYPYPSDVAFSLLSSLFRGQGNPTRQFCPCLFHPTLHLIFHSVVYSGTTKSNSEHITKPHGISNNTSTHQPFSYEALPPDGFHPQNCHSFLIHESACAILRSFHSLHPLFEPDQLSQCCSEHNVPTHNQSGRVVSWLGQPIQV